MWPRELQWLHGLEQRHRVQGKRSKGLQCQICALGARVRDISNCG